MLPIRIYTVHQSTPQTSCTHSIAPGVSVSGTLILLSAGTIKLTAVVENSFEPSIHTVYPAFLADGLESSIILVEGIPMIPWNDIVVWEGIDRGE